MKHIYTISILLLFSSVLMAQSKSFPKYWEGNWKGEVDIFSANGNHKIPMSLVIQPIDSARWSWILHYEAPNQTARKYELIQDRSDWKIDEKNGIILPQQFFGDRMANSFSVSGNLLTCYFWLDGDILNMEIHSVSQKPDGKTITNTEEKFEVENHFIGSFQQAKLFRK